jgi:hypothetical protein
MLRSLRSLRIQLNHVPLGRLVIQLLNPDMQVWLPIWTLDQLAILDFVEIVWVYIWVIYAHLNPYVGVYPGSSRFVQSPMPIEACHKTYFRKLNLIISLLSKQYQFTQLEHEKNQKPY